MIFSRHGHWTASVHQAATMRQAAWRAACCITACMERPSNWPPEIKPSSTKPHAACAHRCWLHDPKHHEVRQRQRLPHKEGARLQVIVQLQA